MKIAVTIAKFLGTTQESFSSCEILNLYQKAESLGNRGVSYGLDETGRTRVSENIARSLIHGLKIEYAYKSGEPIDIPSFHETLDALIVYNLIKAISTKSFSERIRINVKAEAEDAFSTLTIMMNRHYGDKFEGAYLFPDVVKAMPICYIDISIIPDSEI